MTGRLILLVEDNPMDADLTQRAFRRLPSPPQVQVAHDGEEALAWIPRWNAGMPRPRVVLLDINMPRVGGLEVLRAFKADPVASLIPVVVHSTSTAPEDVRAAYQSGAASFVAKPVDFDRFLGIAAQIDAYWLNTNQPAP